MKRGTSERILRIALPALLLAIVVVAWDAVVRLFAIPAYVLPSPGLVFGALVDDRALLFNSLLVTLGLTFEGFFLAAAGGIVLAMAFNQWRLVEYSFYPYAVILQVTPVVAIAPLLLIYLPQHLAVLACAWIVAFFPVLANTTLGLNSVDHNLVALFGLYKASRWQVLTRLKLPAALPQILALEERLRSSLLPHQQAEERLLYPAAARLLGGRDPMAPLIRMHAEIEALVERLAALRRLAEQRQDWSLCAPELRRALFALEVLLRVHLAAEEEVLAGLEATSP